MLGDHACRRTRSMPCARSGDDKLLPPIPGETPDGRLRERWPGDDQANPAVPTRVNDHNHRHLVHFPDTDLANLVIILAVLQPGQNGSAKDPLLRFEADAVLADIGLVPGVVPVKHPGPFVTIFCTYNAVERNELPQAKISTAGRDQSSYARSQLIGGHRSAGTTASGTYSQTTPSPSPSRMKR